MSNTSGRESYILTINSGSSSIKFSLCKISGKPKLTVTGEVENSNTGTVFFRYTELSTGKQARLPLESAGQPAAALFLIKWMEAHYSGGSIVAIGHRIVHGMQHLQPEKITPALINALREAIPYDPEHLPGEIALLELFQQHFPKLLQVACFDTSFHSTMPEIAKILPVPRRFMAAGLQRYGFHGLSYAWMMQELTRRLGAEAAKAKIVLAHLGNGASLAAVKDGRSIDTSMGFTPAGGLPMGTRTGDLDPGVACYLLQTATLSPEEFNHVVNHESGLLGISGTSADMRILLTAAKTDTHAAATVAFFCYQVKKWIGAYTAALEGIDLLVFSGGIGQHAPEIRQRICAGLGFLGITLDQGSNEKNAAIISAAGSRVGIHVINANEEMMIAQLTAAVLATIT